MNVALVGPGAIGRQHVEAIRNIDGLDISCVVGGNDDEAAAFADAWEIGQWTSDLDDCLRRADIEGVIIATPTFLHAAQAIRCMRAGKHVLVEIPFATNLADAERVVRVQAEHAVVAMAAHTNRFRPGHRWINEQLRSGKIRLQQLSVATHFMRRTNINAQGLERSWTDHLLWHHACHGVDMFAFQSASAVHRLAAVRGPVDENLGIAMDLAIILGAADGAVCTISLSFNNDGPQGSTFRYICDGATYVTRLDQLWDGFGNPLDEGLTDRTPGVEEQDRDFLEACTRRRPPVSDLRSVMPAMKTLAQIEVLLEADMPENVP